MSNVLSGETAMTHSHQWGDLNNFINVSERSLCVIAKLVHIVQNCVVLPV